MSENFDVVIVGAGLAGLSCGYELTAKGKKVLIIEAHPFAGGRTSSFKDNGMQVESGLHRYIGYYTALPNLLKKCGVKIGDIVTWEEKVDILIKNHTKKMVLGLAPFFAPVKTLKGILGNSHILTVRDKLAMVPFFIKGFTSYIFSENLDNFSVAEYANKNNVSENSKRYVLEPLSSGIFFMPPENYSAYAFFGLFAPAIAKFYKMRIGAFLGGMTEVMCNPVVSKIKSQGGIFHFGETVSGVVIRNGKVVGVKAADGKEYFASQTVIATAINSAKKILEPLKSSHKLDNLFKLPEMSACTLQMELTQPSLEKDITTFAPGTDMVSFAEQSRSTFTDLNGRLSVILGNANEYCNKSAEEIFKTVLGEMKSLGVDLKDIVTDYRKVSEKVNFILLIRAVKN